MSGSLVQSSYTHSGQWPCVVHMLTIIPTKIVTLNCTIVLPHRGEIEARIQNSRHTIQLRNVVSILKSQLQPCFVRCFIFQR
jgi:hypothetical protein